MPQNFNPNPSVLASLSQEQQQQILAWLDLHRPSEVLKMVAAPPPEGFGIETHPNSLKRFYARHRLSAAPESAKLAAEMISAGAGGDDFDAATATALQQIAFELANSPRIGSKQFRALSRWVLKLRDQQHQKDTLGLAQRRLELDAEKFRFNAARQALIHYAELTTIAKSADKDNEDKIRAVADLLFRPAALADPAPAAISNSNAHPSLGRSKTTTDN